LCRCKCGVEKEVEHYCLTRKRAMSCGCLGRENRAKGLKISNDLRRLNGTLGKPKTHGLSKTPLYPVLNNIKDRCNNTDNEEYHNYGGRGIKVCKEWSNSMGIVAFTKWAENNGYKKGLQIDRKDNNGPYAPWNCRWVTPKVNSNNKRNTLVVNYEGQKLSFTDYTKLLGIVNLNTARKRVKLGWDLLKAGSTPPDMRYSRCPKEEEK